MEIVSSMAKMHSHMIHLITCLHQKRMSHYWSGSVLTSRVSDNSTTRKTVICDGDLILLYLLLARNFLTEILSYSSQGDDKMGMLAVQTLRNKLMDTILTATISMTMLVALAALTNNTYQATQSPSIHSPLLGLQHGKVYALKFGSASVFLVLSFLCSSLGIAFLIDANFLINACGAHDDGMVMSSHTQWVLERGFLLALIGNRVLCITFPLLLWMFGPIPVALSSLALVWVLYELDFGAKCVVKNKD